MSQKDFEDSVDSIESWYSSVGKDLSSSSNELEINGITLSTLIDFPGFNWETFGPYMNKVLKLSVQIFAQISNKDVKSALLQTIEFCLENKNCRDFFIDQRFISVIFKASSKLPATKYPEILFLFSSIYRQNSSILQQIDFNFLLLMIEQALENDKDFGVDFVQKDFPQIVESLIKSLKNPVDNNNLIFFIYNFIIPEKCNWKKAYKALPILLNYPESQGQNDNQGNSTIPFEISSLYLQFCMETEHIEIPPKYAMSFFSFALNNAQFQQLFFEKIPDIFKFAEEREWETDQFFNQMIEIFHMQPHEFPKSISAQSAEKETQTENEPDHA